MLSVYNGEIYWGTMTIGTAYTGAFTAANPSVGVSPASRDDIARAMFSRAAHLFKIKVSNLEHPEIELLFGNEYFPTLNKEDGTWSLKKNLLNLTPKLGKAGFGYGTNNYSWESTVYNGKLFIGTMDYSGGLVDYVENAPPHSDQQIDANYRVAKEQGFMPGGDLLVFEHPNEQPIIITRSGLDNIDNNGFRNFVTVNNTLYAGTSSEANIGPHAGYSFYVLNN